MAKPETALPNMDTTVPSVMIVKSRVQSGGTDCCCVCSKQCFMRDSILVSIGADKVRQGKKRQSDCTNP